MLQSENDNIHIGVAGDTYTILLSGKNTAQEKIPPVSSA
jgi:hypothetical protein